MAEAHGLIIMLLIFLEKLSHSKGIVILGALSSQMSDLF